jgi:lactate permease
MMEVWPACLVCGLSFAITQFLVSNFIGPNLVDIIGSVVSMGCTLLLLKLWKPKTSWHFEHETKEGRQADADARPDLTAGRVAKAWMPWATVRLRVCVGLPGLQGLPEWRR